MKQFKSQKSDQYRVLSNEKYRRNYIQKKYGVTLGPGEYFDKKTMSGVKQPPKTYAAWERKKLGIESAPPPKKSTPSRERQVK
jgi:curved DNA-binding protein CbpA